MDLLNKPGVLTSRQRDKLLNQKPSTRNRAVQTDETLSFRSGFMRAETSLRTMIARYHAQPVLLPGEMYFLGELDTIYSTQQAIAAFVERVGPGNYRIVQRGKRLYVAKPRDKD